MSTNTSEQTFTTDCPDLQKFLKDLNLLDKNVASAAADGIHEGAAIIATEQKRLIAPYSDILPTLIKPNKIQSDKKGKVYCDVGYDSDAIKTHIEAVIMEFGRPGKVQGKKETQRKTKNGTVTVKVGVIPERSHIRRAFDNKAAEATKKAIDKVNAEIEKIERS